MHVDGARLDIDILAPHRVEQLLAREDAAGMLHEVAQQAELGRAEMDGLAAADHAVRHQVHHDVGVVQRLVGSAGRMRRSTARMRATSSVGENGLAT